MADAGIQHEQRDQKFIFFFLSLLSILYWTNKQNVERVVIIYII